LAVEGAPVPRELKEGVELLILVAVDLLATAGIRRCLMAPTAHDSKSFA
jgi:hypothetical protein